MKIIIVGATGTMGKHLTSAFEKDNEVIKAASKGGDIQVDVTSTESIENMYRQVGAFDALISKAGPTYIGPWKKMTDEEFRKGVNGKMSQINLVPIGQHYTNPRGSFSLITGALTHDPQINFANASAANGAIE